MAHKREEHDAPISFSLAPQKEPVSVTLPHVVSLPALLDQPVAEPDWLIPGLLPTSVSLLAGPARVDNPLLANQLSCSVVTAVAFPGLVPARPSLRAYL